MPGNRTVFQDALRKAHNLAWDRKWPQAIGEYQRALAEVDGDPAAWVGLGAALIEASRLSEAKEAYQRASDLAPGDVGILQKLAEIFERLGDPENAAQMYLLTANGHVRNGAPLLASHSLRAILRLVPGHVASRRLLAEVLQQLDRPSEAAQEQMTLARQMHERGRPLEAADYARRALALQPQHAEALTFLLRLRAAAPEVESQDAERPASEDRGVSPVAPAAPTDAEQLARPSDPSRTMLRQLLQSLKDVELQAVGAERAEALERVYTHLSGRLLSEDGQFESLSFITTLVGFMDDKNWAGRASQLRHTLDEMGTRAETTSVAELIGYPVPEHVLALWRQSQEWLRREKPGAALDDCLRAIAFAPTFLPLHSHLSEIFFSLGRLDPAVDKLRMMAALLQVRGDRQALIEIHRQILRLQPQDTDVRAALIDLLVAQGAMEEALPQAGPASGIRASSHRLEALEHCIVLADIYAQTAEPERAVKAYQRALSLTPEDRDDRWRLTIYHGLGEVQMQRAGWAEAIETYRHIIEIAPDDDKASLRLIDLLLRQNRADEAMRDLTRLIDHYERSGDLTTVLNFVSGMSEAQPGLVSLKHQMATILSKLGRVEEAVVALDELSQSQIKAGQSLDAIRTVERILSLNPPAPERYRALLAQLQQPG